MCITIGAHCSIFLTFRFPNTMVGGQVCLNVFSPFFHLFFCPFDNHRRKRVYPELFLERFLRGNHRYRPSWPPCSFVDDAWNAHRCRLYEGIYFASLFACRSGRVLSSRIPCPFSHHPKNVRLSGIDLKGNVRLVANLTIDSGSPLVASGTYTGATAGEVAVGGPPVNLLVDTPAPR